MSKRSKKNKEELLDDGDVGIVKSNKKKTKKKNKTDDVDDDKFDLIISEEEQEDIETVQKSKKKGSKKKNLKQSASEIVDEPELSGLEFTDDDEEIMHVQEEFENVVDKKLDELTIQERETTPDQEVDKKLTHKEKKKLKQQQKQEHLLELMTRKGGQGHSDLDSNFTMSQAQKTSGQKAQLEHAVDIKIENFTISAKGK